MCVFIQARRSKKKELASRCMTGRLLPKIKNQKQIQEQECVRDETSESEIVVKMRVPKVFVESSRCLDFYAV